MITIKDIVKISSDSLDIQKAEDFAHKMINKDAGIDYQYNRYDFTENKRIHSIVMGKLGEQAFSEYLKRFNVDFPVNYDIYENQYKGDDSDGVINDKHIDIKTSMYFKSLEEAIDTYSFPVPKEQEIKDITVSVLTDKGMHNFYIVSWIDKDTYKNNASEEHFANNISYNKYFIKDGNRIIPFF